MDMGLPYTSLIESLENQVAQGLFTAWSCAHADGALAAFFVDESEPSEWLLDQNAELHPHQPVMRTWFPAFDLASLTKPLLANAWLRLRLGADPVLWLQSPLASLIEPRSAEGEDLKKWCEKYPWMTLAHLLNHTSGLPPWTWFGRALWRQTEKDGTARGRAVSRMADLQSDAAGAAALQARRDLTAHILNIPLTQNAPTAETIYSDLNYYLLARVIENLALQKFSGWTGVVEELNQHWQTNFWHASTDPERSRLAIPYYPYVHSQVVAHVYENRKLTNHAGEFGAVHDTNANILATDFRASYESTPVVSSHAGLFGNILDVAKTVPFFVQSQAEFESLNVPPTISSPRFRWGLDTPSNAMSTAGLKAWPLNEGRSIFGHLGYTGTSLWMADDGQFHILLTNRTACRRVSGGTSVPRILIFQKDSQTLPLCWIKSQSSVSKQGAGQGWQPIPWQEAYTLCFEHSRMVTRYWDRHCLRSPPDLAFVRRSTGQLLWSH